MNAAVHSPAPRKLSHKSRGIRCPASSIAPPVTAGCRDLRSRHGPSIAAGIRASTPVNELDHPLAVYVQSQPSSLARSMPGSACLSIRAETCGCHLRALLRPVKPMTSHASRAEAARGSSRRLWRATGKAPGSLEARGRGNRGGRWMIRGVKQNASELRRRQAGLTPQEPLTKNQIRNLASKPVTLRLCATAAPELQSSPVRRLGVQLRYDPFQRLVTASALLCTQVRVGGGT